MLAVLSPAKTLDFETPLRTKKFTMPGFLDRSQELIEILRGYDVEQLRSLMGISEKIATLNHGRYQDFDPAFKPKNARQALLTFKGDSYFGFKLEEYTAKDFEHTQKHLRILSGLYGLLRPLDLMQAYRLEMGTKLNNDHGKTLYAFWGKEIAETLNIALSEQGDDILVNLASNEYFKSINKKVLKATIIQPVFKDLKNGKYKNIAFYAKRARGAMVDFIIRNRIETPEQLKAFNVDGYGFHASLSNDDTFVFTRDPEKR